jgi:intron-binding protein aquarius
VTGEWYGNVNRLIDDETNGAEMAGVEQLGQYVYEMTQQKIKALKENGAVLPDIAEEDIQGVDSDGDGNVVDENVPEGDEEGD